MSDQIYIGNFGNGMKTNPLPFNIDNDAFPTLYNAYSWRGRAKRKRGTKFLARLQVMVQSVLNAPPPLAWQYGQITLGNGGFVNLLGFLGFSPNSIFITGIDQISQAPQTVVSYTVVAGPVYQIGQVVLIFAVNGMPQINGGYYTIVNTGVGTMTINVDSTLFSPYISGGLVSLASGPSIVPGSINLTVGANTYTEPSPPTGKLIGTPTGSANIFYSTGLMDISGGVGKTMTGTFAYYPDLPVLGLEDFVSNSATAEFPLLIGFDTTYSYQINQNGTPFFYNTNYYKNTNNPVYWSNLDYAQFWSTNYQSAFWATNNKSGLHLVNGAYVSGSGTNVLTLTFTTPNYVTPPSAPYTTLIVGDQLWFNEWTASTVNQQTGTITAIVVSLLGNKYTVTFNIPVTASGSGIAQLLTNSLSGQDGIRWYDGDPTAGTGLPTNTGLGWVNFAPPLTATNVNINDQVPGLYYLVGALAIVAFKDRLLFFGPQIQTSSGAPIQVPLQDTVIWSWNGTPYYNSLVPTNINNTETFDALGRTFWVDQVGFGGYLSAGISKPIVTVLDNEDVLLVGFGGSGKKTRFVYTGNDLQPFLFYLINSELPSNSTFSGVVLDRGGLEIGAYGITLTTQQSCQRVDLDIPDEVFEIQALNNGQNRVNAVRDFYREWIYFSFPTGDGKASAQSWIYPSNTFLFNYRDNTWAILRENFTHHGTFRRGSGYTWANPPAKTWATWNEPWNAGTAQAQFPSIIGGNPQGFVLIKGEDTDEGISGDIQGISNDGMGNTQITSLNHCVNSSSPDGDDEIYTENDYLSFGGPSIGLVINVIDANNFVVDIPFPSTANISAIDQGVMTTLTINFNDPSTPPYINSYFVGQTVSISGVIGMTQLNGNTYAISGVTPTSITIVVDSTGFSPYISGGLITLATYIGTGSYARLSQPLIQTKQFPFYWQQGRQVRLGVQKYLMDTTSDGQVTININLSQDPNTAYNNPNTANNTGLEYSQILYTCPESTNLGLSAPNMLDPANTNLQLPLAVNQYQTWHRINTSLQGDSVQIGITLSDTQMRNLDYATDEIALQGIQLTVSPGPLVS